MGDGIRTACAQQHARGRSRVCRKWHTMGFTGLIKAYHLNHMFAYIFMG